MSRRRGEERRGEKRRCRKREAEEKRKKKGGKKDGRRGKEDQREVGVGKGRGEGKGRRRRIRGWGKGGEGEEGRRIGKEEEWRGEGEVKEIRRREGTRDRGIIIEWGSYMHMLIHTFHIFKYLRRSLWLFRNPPWFHKSCVFLYYIPVQWARRPMGALGWAADQGP
jgi:hypothetical protein